MQTCKKVDKYIRQHSLINNNAKVIVGVSGGADSMALLNILHHLGYECIVAHCNFHLRGQESYRDQYFVEKACSKYKVKFITTNFDTKKYIYEESISLEMAARELRYAWFEKIRVECKADKIAVAHHQDDSIETVLINLIRGTGIRGLTGISPLNGHIIRPLLCLYRADILEYLAQKQIDFVQDSTNEEDIYTRNKIRLNVIPLLKTINPSVTQAISRTAENLAHTETIFNAYIEKAKQTVFSNNTINIESLLQHIEPETVLFEILFPYGFNAPTVNQIFKSINSQSGKIFESAEYRLLKDRNTFILEPSSNIADHTFHTLHENETEINSPIKLYCETFCNDIHFKPEKSKKNIYLDKSKLSFPLIIRKWKHGDKFIPFGMKGHKKLSDYFSDNKFSLIDKENIWLLCSENNIVWIIGERADNRFRVTDKTTEILKLTTL